MHKLYFSQNLPINLKEAWEFFSSPANLKKITPPSLNFHIVDNLESKGMYAGKLIFYTFQPIAHIRLKWVAEITAFQEPFYFIDEQKFGPYSFWHHEHWFSSIPGGVKMEDIVYYKLPLGILGKVLQRLKVKKDLEEIFAYRQSILEQMFGKFPSLNSSND